MQKLQYFIFILMAIALMAGCAEDNETLEQQGRDVHFCVRTSWQNGLSGGSSTRVLTTTSLLAGDNADIVISTDDYPATIDVHCSNNTDFTLSKGTALCGTHSEYMQYTPSVIYKDNEIERDKLTFTAKAVIDEDGDPETTADGDRLEGTAILNDGHMRLDLHHTKTLLRFAFKVDKDYDKIRFIKVTGITLNGTTCFVADQVLSQTSAFIAYAYVDPTVVTTTYSNTLACTYNIYDKDAKFDGTMSSEELKNHLTREGVTAQNKFTLNKVKDVNGDLVAKIDAGYYYDLKVTLNPDYLYVLSEHDNKQHLKVE